MKIERRGYRNKDEVIFSQENVIILHEAYLDLVYLLNHGYNRKSSLELVGNHFKLKDRQRMLLFRSTDKEFNNKERLKRQITVLNNKSVFLDAFNVLIILETALSGSIIYKAADGTIKDLAGLRGTYHIIGVTKLAIKMVLDYLQKEGVIEATFLVDKMVSNSGRLCHLINQISQDYKLEVKAVTEAMVDYTLMNKNLVITSDSIILNKCGDWYNLTSQLIKEIDNQWLIDITK